MISRVHSIVFLLLLSAVICSCDTEPEIGITQYQSKLVIDGWIEENDFPRVILSASSSYFDNIDSTTVRNLVVTTAKVTVSDGVSSEVLTLKKDENYFPPYVYTGTKFRGVAGRAYRLTVESKGEKYTASTTIPPSASLDDLWFEAIPEVDSLGYIYGKFTDNPAEENFYRVFTRRRNKDQRFIPVYLSAIGDQSFNGKSFTFSLLRGPDNFAEVIDDLYFEKGDTVRVKFCTMDKAHFDFWRTLEREIYLIGNPFASSGNDVLSNIDDKKALGVWGGYGVRYYDLIAR